MKGFTFEKTALIESMPGRDISFHWREIDNPALIHHANTLPCFGVLKQPPNQSYLYLKIQDDFIHQLFPMLKEQQHMKKPDYFVAKNAIGAHITVIYFDEFQVGLEISERENTFSFEVTGLFEVKAFHKCFIACTIVSQELESVREKYGLAKKLNYKGLLVPFHITIATA